MERLERPALLLIDLENDIVKGKLAPPDAAGGPGIVQSRLGCRCSGLVGAGRRWKQVLGRTKNSWPAQEHAPHRGRWRTLWFPTGCVLPISLDRTGRNGRVPAWPIGEDGP